jgi:hypothetical protein
MEFIELVRRHACMRVEVVAVYEDGSSNTREILQINKI